MKRKILIALALLPLLAACAQAGKPQTDRELKGMGMVVVHNLAADASEKIGVKALTDAGNELFGPGILNHRNGGESSSGGGNMSFPRWVRVTWRDGVDDAKGLYWTTGKVVGDYKVEVLNRIPEEIFNYAAAARGRAIVLRFRLKDNGVLLAWDVRESSLNGQGWVYKMHGGDFLDAKMYNGKLVDPGWEK